MLDGDLLEKATRAFGVKTYSAAVNLALAEAVRAKQIQALPQFFGKGLWQGNLSEMRRDGPGPTRRNRPGRKKARG